MNETIRFWDEKGFNFVFSTSADVSDVVEAINYVKENIEDYDNQSVVMRLEELGFIVEIEDEIPQENTFYWG